MAFCCCEQDQDLDFWYMGNRFDSSIWSTFAYLERGPQSSGGNICYLDPLTTTLNKEKDWPVINRWIEMKGEWTYKYGLWQEGFSAGTITPEDVYGIWTREITDKVSNWDWGWGDWVHQPPFYVTKTQIRGNGFKWRHNPANRCLSRCAIKSELCDPQYPDRNLDTMFENACTGQPFKICDCYNSDTWNVYSSSCFADSPITICEALLNPVGAWDLNSTNGANWYLIGIPNTTLYDSSRAVHRSSVHEPNRLVSSKEYHMANRNQLREQEVIVGQPKIWQQTPYTHYFDCTNGGSGTGDQDPDLVWCPSGICRNAVCSRPGLEYCCKSQEYFKIKEVEGITFTISGLTGERLIGGWDTQCAIAARESELCLYEAKAFRMYTPMEIDKTPTPPFFDNKSWKSTEPVYHPGKTFDNCNDLCEEFKFPDLDCEKANHFVWRDRSYITSAPDDWETNVFKSNEFNPPVNAQPLEGQCWACISYWDYPWRRVENQFSVCGGSTGKCCEANPGIRGCSDPDCCSRVCWLNSKCCTDEWGITCANVAKLYCPSCGASKTDYGPFSPYGLLGYNKTYCTGGSLIPNSCDCKRENIKLPGFTYGIDIVSGPNYLDQIIKTSPHDWKAFSISAEMGGGVTVNSPFWKTMYWNKSKRETNAFNCDNCIIGTSDGYGNFKPSSTASIFDTNWINLRDGLVSTIYDTTDLAFIPTSSWLHWKYSKEHTEVRYNSDQDPLIRSMEYVFPYQRDHNQYALLPGADAHDEAYVPYYQQWNHHLGAITFRPTLPYVTYFLKWNDNIGSLGSLYYLNSWDEAVEGTTKYHADGFNSVGRNFSYVGPDRPDGWSIRGWGPPAGWARAAHEQVYYDGESSCWPGGGAGGV